MLPKLLALCLSAAPFASRALAAPAPAPAAVLQEELEDEREAVEALIDKLSDHVGAHGKEDLLAIEVVDQLVTEFQRSGPKDRDDIVGALDKSLKAKRREDRDGNRDNRMYVAVAKALGTMGPESASVLEGWVDHKTHRKFDDVNRELILSLGRTKVEDSTGKLTSLLKNQNPIVVGAAAEALGNYGAAPQALRKDIFNEVLKQLMTAYNAKENPSDLIAQERWNTYGPAMITTLQLITGHDEREPNRWRDWWNDNKRKNWDEGKEQSGGGSR